MHLQTPLIVYTHSQPLGHVTRSNLTQELSLPSNSSTLNPTPQKKTLINILIGFPSSVIKTMKVVVIFEWMKKMWHLYIMEYYLITKRNKCELFAAKSMQD